MFKREALKRMIILTFLISILFITNPFVSKAKTCEEGLQECLVVALISTLSNPYVGLGVGAWCVYGYEWCKTYLEG